VRSLFAVLVLSWMVLSALSRQQAPSTVSPIIPQIPSSNRYEKRYDCQTWQTFV